MTDISVDSITPLRQELITVYSDLPTVEQMILQLFSLIYGSASRSLVLDCWQQLAQKDKQYQSFTQQSLKLHLDNLLEGSITPKR